MAVFYVLSLCLMSVFTGRMVALYENSVRGENSESVEVHYNQRSVYQILNVKHSELKAGLHCTQRVCPSQFPAFYRVMYIGALPGTSVSFAVCNRESTVNDRTDRNRREVDTIVSKNRQDLNLTGTTWRNTRAINRNYHVGSSKTLKQKQTLTSTGSSPRVNFLRRRRYSTTIMKQFEGQGRRGIRGLYRRRSGRSRTARRRRRESRSSDGQAIFEIPEPRPDVVYTLTGVCFCLNVNSPPQEQGSTNNVSLRRSLIDQFVDQVHGRNTLHTSPTTQAPDVDIGSRSAARGDNPETRASHSEFQDRLVVFASFSHDVHFIGSISMTVSVTSSCRPLRSSVPLSPEGSTESPTHYTPSVAQPCTTRETITERPTVRTRKPSTLLTTVRLNPRPTDRLTTNHYTTDWSTGQFTTELTQSVQAGQDKEDDNTLVIWQAALGAGVGLLGLLVILMVIGLWRQGRKIKENYRFIAREVESRQHGLTRGRGSLQSGTTASTSSMPLAMSSITDRHSDMSTLRDPRPVATPRTVPALPRTKDWVNVGPRRARPPENGGSPPVRKGNDSMRRHNNGRHGRTRHRGVELGVDVMGHSDLTMNGAPSLVSSGQLFPIHIKLRSLSSAAEAARLKAQAELIDLNNGVTELKKTQELPAQTSRNTTNNHMTSGTTATYHSSNQDTNPVPFEQPPPPQSKNITVARNDIIIARKQKDPNTTNDDVTVRPTRREFDLGEFAMYRNDIVFKLRGLGLRTGRREERRRKKKTRGGGGEGGGDPQEYDNMEYEEGRGDDYSCSYCGGGETDI